MHFLDTSIPQMILMKCVAEMIWETNKVPANLPAR